MRTERFGGLTCRVVGDGDGPLVILMHGFGAPGDDLVPLVDFLDARPETRFLFPEAPVEMPAMFGDARAWWMLDLEALDRALESGEGRDLSGGVPDGMPEARDKAITMIAEAREALGVAPEQTVLGGFSQGAMLAADVAFRTDEPLAGLALLSGTLVSEDEWKKRAPGRAGLEVFQSHGRMDPLLAFGAAEKLRELLTGAGLKVEWHPFDGAHEIQPPILDAFGDFLKRVL